MRQLAFLSLLAALIPAQVRAQTATDVNPYGPPESAPALDAPAQAAPPPVTPAAPPPPAPVTPTYVAAPPQATPPTRLTLPTYAAPPTPTAPRAPAPAPYGYVLVPQTAVYPPAYVAPGYVLPGYAPVVPSAPTGAYYYVPNYVLPAAPTVLSPAEVARRDILYSELRIVEGRLDRLNRDRPSLVGPIAMMGFGYSLMMFSSAVALSSFAAAEAIENHDYDAYDQDDLDIDDDGQVDGDDERRFRRFAYGFAGAAGFGLTVGLISTITLAKRAAKRRSSDAERRSLIEQRDNLRRALDYGVGVMPQQLHLSMQGRF